MTEQPATPPLAIAVMDDDADFLEFISSELSAAGHRVNTCQSPEAFLRVCEDRLPDVALIDMNMGEHDGSDVLREIRERWSKLCVIVVTGYPSMDSMRETFKQDVFDYLAKPFSGEALAGVLSQAAHTLKLGQRPQDRLRDELGRRIRLARTERDWTLKDLGQRSGVSVSQLSAIERGTHLPSLESLLAVADALEIPASSWLQAADL